ncbi:MAG: hypothetical protein M1157_08270 [Deinococcus sp.]|nr:hypothetical protein [Deinococcus sp.]
MRVLFVEGKNAEPLRALASKFRHPYRVLFSKEQDLYLLEMWGVGEQAIGEAENLEGVRAWSFVLLEEGMPGAEQ